MKRPPHVRPSRVSCGDHGPRGWLSGGCGLGRKPVVEAVDPGIQLLEHIEVHRRIAAQGMLDGPHDVVHAPGVRQDARCLRSGHLPLHDGGHGHHQLLKRAFLAARIGQLAQLRLEFLRVFAGHNTMITHFVIPPSLTSSIIH